MFLKCFIKIAGRSNNYRFDLPKFLKFCDNISHKLLRPYSVNSWKNLWKFWSDPFCRNNLDPIPLLNVVAYWKSSNSEACTKTLFQILANNIDTVGRGISFIIYVCFRYCCSYMYRY